MRHQVERGEEVIPTGREELAARGATLEELMGSTFIWGRAKKM
jgi:hypothetical protein